MGIIAIDEYLEPLSEEAPCGENLEYDAAFMQLESLIERTESDISILDWDERDWERIFSDAEDILSRTKDLRVAISLAHAALNQYGLPGLLSGLTLVKGLICTFWDSLHPQLDEADNYDAIQRINCLQMLSNPCGLLYSLRRIPIVRNSSNRGFSLRDLQIADGSLHVKEYEDIRLPNRTEMRAAFLESDHKGIIETYKVANQCCAVLEEIERFLDDHIGEDNPARTLYTVWVMPYVCHGLRAELFSVTHHIWIYLRTCG